MKMLYPFRDISRAQLKLINYNTVVRKGRIGPNNLLVRAFYTSNPFTYIQKRV